MNDLPTPPNDLVSEGEAWAREQFLVEHESLIDRYVAQCWMGAQNLFIHHRDQLLEAIDQGGGIERFERVRNDRGLNGIRLRDGDFILASTILNRIYNVAELNPGPTLPPGADQKFVIHASFGGTGLGISPELALEADRLGIGAPDLQAFFADDFNVQDLLLTESILTTFNFSEGNSPSHLTENHYSISSSAWVARLRPEFGGHPDDPGFARIDFMFTASGPIEGRWERWKTGKGMVTYIDRYGHVKQPELAIPKFIRFIELLKYCHKQTTGEDLIINIPSLMSPTTALPSSTLEASIE